MTTRIPLPYNQKILKLFVNPKNAGRLKDANVKATVGSPACGDMITLYLKINEKEQIIEKATFESYGCAANIAAASMLTQMVKGKKIKDAWKIDWKVLSNKLGGLPAIKYHCSILAVGALKRAIREFYKNRKKPSWLPKKITQEEMHVLEKEKMFKFFKR